MRFEMKRHLGFLRADIQSKALVHGLVAERESPEAEPKSPERRPSSLGPTSSPSCSTSTRQSNMA